MPAKPVDFTSAIDRVLSSAKGTQRRGLVDIITFCENPKYLNFSGQGLSLWPMQRIVLKMFYRGSEGNEHLSLTDEEIAVLKTIAKEEKFDYDEKLGGFEQIITKYKDGAKFTHLLLVMGRRSSKTMVVSIIAAYEAYKLCECPEGNPQKFYKCAPDKPIHIINLAINEDQALDPLFVEIEARIARSEYFTDKINNEAKLQGKIYILTDADKTENERRRKAGINIPLKGSILLMSGHSNSASLRGHATKAILFDEYAHFQTTSGKNSGDELYRAMTPSMRQFGDEGKVVMLSDPNGKQGMFWRLFELSQKREKKPDGTIKFAHEKILAIQLPTWRMNPGPEFSKEALEAEERPKDPSSFPSTYGARFIGSEGLKFFDDLKIEDCVDLTLKEAERGELNRSYYIHLDPGTKSHKYALVMGHSETYANAMGESKKKIVVDLVKFWVPTEKGPVSLREVELYIKKLCAYFRVVKVTFDAFQAEQTIQNLRMCGITAEETAFRPHYITEIYGALRNLVNENDLILYPHEDLIEEMKGLLFNYRGRNINVFFDPGGDHRSDDLVDALAGMAYQALHTEIQRSLPRSGVVWTGWR